MPNTRSPGQCTGSVAAAVLVAVLGLVMDFAIFRRLRGVQDAYVLIATYALLLVTPSRLLRNAGEPLTGGPLLP